MEQSLYELLRECTVRISLPGGTEHGTGFFVAPGLILTCAHVIKNPNHAKGSFEVNWSGQTYSATVKALNGAADLALLQIHLSKHPCVALQVEVTPFDTLYSYGYTDDHPLGDPITFTLEGRNQEGQLKFKFGQVRPGLSGAPMLNTRTGYVCGIVQITRDRSTDLGGRAVSTSTVFQEFPEIEQLQKQFHLKDRHWTTLVPSPNSDQNRQRLLKKVRAFWITNVLESSLQGTTLITPNLSKQQDAAVDPWHLILQRPDKAEETFASGTCITQVYDDAEDNLLILGEPGSGKTTLLLELAHELLNRASINEDCPIPVVFNLSSWTMSRQSISNWLVNELNDKYQVPRKIGRFWVSADQILPLLDGLDEVPKEHRTACINAINTYWIDHGFVPTVLCCRSSEYLALTTRLQIQHAVTVQPLTPQQVDGYLSDGGEQLEAVRIALRDDSLLHELVETPLMLSILAKAYCGKPVENLHMESSSMPNHQSIFTAYIQRMLQRRGPEVHYTNQQTTRWLAWLGYQMKQQNQTEFYIERMQPNWYLETWRLSFSYHVLVRLIIALHSCLLSSFIFALLFCLLFQSSLGSDLELALLIGAIFGLFVGMIIPLEREIKPAEAITWPWRNTWKNLAKDPSLRVALLFGFLFGGVNELFLQLFYKLSAWPIGIIFGFIAALIFEQFLRKAQTLPSDTLDKDTFPTSHLSERSSMLHIGLIFGLVSGLSYTLLSVFIFGLTFILLLLYSLASTSLTISPQEWSFSFSYILFFSTLHGLSSGFSIGFANRKKMIKPIETFLWLGKSLWQRVGKIETLMYGMVSGLLYGLLGGLLFGGGIGLLFGLIDGIIVGMITGLFFCLIGTIVFWLFNILISGLSTRMVDEHTLVNTNQGMRNSVRNSLLIGLVCGLIGGLIFFGLAFGFVFRYGMTIQTSLTVGLLFGTLGGVVSGLIIGLSNGGSAYIQHMTLRLFLWRVGSLPWNYPRFLDYAVERIFLRKVGGGYIFIHRLLLEHFSTLNITSTSAQARANIRPIRKSEKSIPSLLIRLVSIISILMSIIFVAWFSLNANLSHHYPSSDMETVFQDPLRTNASNLWPTDQYSAHNDTCTFTPEGYQVHAKKQGIISYCAAHRLHYSNFALEVRIVIIQGDKGGIIFRTNTESGSFYYFWIDQKGSYGFSIERNHRMITTLSSGFSLAINGGLNRFNLLAIVAQKNTFNLYINHRLIKTVTDPDHRYAQGQIGFTGENNGTTTIVRYTNVRIWVSLRTPSTLPTDFYVHSNWNLFLNEPMDKNDGLWHTNTSSMHGSVCMFTAQSYELATTKQQSSAFCGNNSTRLSNGAIEVELTIVKGNDGGIFFRADAKTGNRYYFRVSQTGGYSLASYHNNIFRRLLGKGFSSALHTGRHQSDLIAVVMQGNIFDLYANHHFITSISDFNTMSTDGFLGFGATEYSRATLLRFTHLRVWSNGRSIGQNDIHVYPPDSWNQVLNEPMNKNDTSWYEFTNHLTNASCTLTSNGYEIISMQKNKLNYCTTQGSGYNNLAVEVQLTILKGNAGGIILHTHRNNYYTFLVGRDGNYNLYHYNNGYYILLGIGSSGAIHTDLGQANVIAVITRGNTFELYINYRFTATIIDPNHTYIYGQLGLAAVAYDSSTQVQYTNIKVWTPSS